MPEKYYNLPFTDGAVGSQGNCNGWVVPGLSPQCCCYPARRYVVFSAECYYCYHLQRRYRGGGEQVTECPNNEPYTTGPAPHRRICMRFEQASKVVADSYCINFLFWLALNKHKWLNCGPSRSHLAQQSQTLTSPSPSLGSV